MTYALPVTATVIAPMVRRTLCGWLDDESIDLQLPLPEAPRFVAFDPDAGLLLRLDDQQDLAGLDRRQRGRLHGRGCKPSPRWGRRTGSSRSVSSPKTHRSRSTCVRWPSRRLGPRARSRCSSISPGTRTTGPNAGRRARTDARSHDRGGTARVGARSEPRRPGAALRAGTGGSGAAARARRALGDARNGRGAVWSAGLSILGQHGELSDIRAILQPGAPPHPARGSPRCGAHHRSAVRTGRTSGSRRTGTGRPVRGAASARRGPADPGGRRGDPR